MLLFSFQVRFQLYLIFHLHIIILIYQSDVFHRSNFQYPKTIQISNFFSYVGFLSRTFTNHRTAGEGEGHFFNSLLPLPPASQTLGHQPSDYCRELTSAHSNFTCFVTFIITHAMIQHIATFIRTQSSNYLHSLQHSSLFHFYFELHTLLFNPHLHSRDSCCTENLLHLLLTLNTFTFIFFLLFETQARAYGSSVVLQFPLDKKVSSEFILTNVALA